MLNKMISRIRHSLTLRIIVVHLVVGPMLILLGGYAFAKILLDSLSTRGEQRISILMAEIALTLEHMERPGQVESYSRKVSKIADLETVLLFDPSTGMILAASDPSWKGKDFLGLVSSLLGNEEVNTTDFGSADWVVWRSGGRLLGTRVATFEEPFLAPTGEFSQARVFISMDLLRLNREVWQYTLFFTFLFLAIWAILIGLLFYQLRIHVARPAAAIRRGLEEWRAGRRVRLGSIDESELGLLSRSFDDAVDSIEAADNRFRQISELLPVGIYLTDEVGSAIYINQKCQELTGLNEEELKGYGWMSVLHPDDQEKVASWWRDLLQTKQTSTMEYRFMVAGHKQMWVIDHAFPIPGNRGVVGAITDITERLTMEQRLRQAHQESSIMASLVEQSVVSIVRTDVRRRIVWANKAFERLTGFSRAEAIGHTPGELLQGRETDPATVEEIRERLNAVQSCHLPILNYRKDGSSYWLEVNISPIFGPEGDHIGWVGLQYDVTERVEAQKALEQSEVALQRRLVLLELVSRSATRPMQETLVEIGGLLNLRRSCIYSLQDSDKTWRKLREWCNEGDGRQDTAMDGMPISQLPWWHSQLEGQSIIQGNKQEWFPPEAVEEAFFFSENGYDSLLAIPLYREDRLHGFFALQSMDPNANWREEDVATLVALGNIFSATIERLKNEANIRESEKRHRTLFESMTQGVVMQDRSGQIVAANPAAEEILGIGSHEVVGRDSNDPKWQATRLDGSHFHGHEHPTMVALATGRVVSNVIMGIYSPRHDARRWIVVNAFPSFDGDEPTPSLVYCTFEDITEKVEAESALRQLNEELEARVRERDLALANEASRSETLALLSTGAAIGEVLDSLIRGVEASNPGFLGSIMLLDETRKHLKIVSCPSLPRAFVQPMDGVQIGPEVGTCGTAVYFGERVVTVNIQEDPKWVPFAPLSLEHGIHSCWSELIRSKDGEILGTFAIYRRESYSPTERDFAIVADSARLASVAIERKNAEEAILKLNTDLERRVAERTEQVQLQAAALGASTEGVCIIINGRPTNVNPAMQKMFGYEDNEWQELTWRMLYDDSEKDLLQQILHHMESNRGWRGEITAKRKDGISFPAEVELTWVLDKGWLLLNRDISERAAARRKLEETNNFLSTLLETLPLGVFWKDADRVYQGCNESYLALRGLKLHEVVGQTDPLHPIDADKMELIRQEDDAILGSMQALMGIVAKDVLEDGTRNYYELNKVPIFGKDGRPTGILGTMKDVSDEKNAEEALRLSEERWQLAINGSNHGIWDGNIREKKAFYSDRWKEIHGYQPHEIGDSESQWRDSIHPDDRDDVIAAVESHLAGGTPHFKMEYRIITKNGGVRWVEDRGMAVWDEKGSPYRMAGSLIDVTERKLAEAALKEKTEELDRFFETTLDLLSISSISGKFLRLNPEWERVLGYPLGDLIDREYMELVHEEDVEATSHALGQLAQGIVINNFQNRYRRADGSYCWIEWRATCQNDLVYSAARDVTKRVEAEERLRTSEIRYRGLMEGAPDAIVISSIDGRLIETNHSAQKLFGYTPEEFLALNYFELQPEVGSDDGNQLFEQLSTRGHFSATEVSIQCKDGTQLPVDVTASRVDTGGEVVIQSVFRDVRQRKQSEQALRELSHRLELALAAANIGCWSIDIATQKLSWDDRMFSIYGVSPTSFKGKIADWENQLHPDDLVAARASLWHTVTKGVEFDTRFRIITGSGEIRHLQAKASYIRERSGLPAQIVGVNFDITKTVEREQILQEANLQLREATRMKDEFLATMSHELRTPLNGVLGLTEALREGIYGKVDERQAGVLSRVEESGRHLLDLINDILDLAKIEAGKAELNIEPIELDGLLRNLSSVSTPLASKKQIEITWDIDRNVEILQGDARRIRQILLNLLGNAIKFTHDGGHVSVSLRADPQHNAAIFAVQDDGIGIPPEKIKLLFRPFTQLEDALTREHGGTGLGLSIVKRLVDLHHGHVSVESEVGKGSRFEVFLPWQPTRQKESNPETPVIISDGNFTDLAEDHDAPLVLLAEDNEMNRKLIEEFLGARNFRVIVACDGRQAVELAQLEIPDLILMDIQMPNMNGFDAMRHLRADARTRGIPMIALTAFAMPGDRERCIEAGANDYLAKPVSLKALNGLIQRLLAASS
jgi:PAS domain S-box-containing protein